MKIHDISAACALIAKAMNESEAQWAEVTMERHFKLHSVQISDGRYYYLCRVQNEIIGIVGLHHYEWGPPQNVWLGWFAVLPSAQGQRLGTFMIEQIQRIAFGLGFQKLFVETYSSPTFDNARQFYQRRGFVEVGTIRDYLENGINMVVYCKNISYET